MSDQMFPLYRRPSSLLFLDDEPGYLEMLAMVMAPEQKISCFTRINDYMDYVHASARDWALDLSLQQQMLNLWHQGKGLPKQVLEYWSTHSQRYSLPWITVVDYAMPSATGLQVLQASPAWPPYRVLLTGKADEQIAVAAFNEGLIDRFLTKQHPDLVRQLLSCLKRLQNSPLDPYESLWSNALRLDRRLALQESDTQHALINWLAQHQCIEYVVLPEPFGLLALDRNGHAHWLQLELAQDLAIASDIAAAAGMDASQQRAITEQQALCNAEWHLAMQSSETPLLATAWKLGQSTQLLAAHFPLSALGKLGQSFNEYVASLPERGTESIG